MRSRLLLPLAVLIAASALASSAGADTFIVVKSGAAPNSSGSAAGSNLPSASFPNFPGSVAFPPNLSQPPAQPMTLDQTQLLALWQSAGAAYDVPWPVLAAINEVESGFGRNMGPSSAGAIGWMQFMPSTWQEWGVDADGNGVADPWNPYDAVYAAARYLAASGGTTDISRAIFSYNHASWYVQDVLRIAQTFSQGQGVTLTAATPAAPQPDLSAPRHAVGVARTRAAAAEASFRKLRTRIARLQRRSNHVTLLSTGLAMQALAGRLRERLPAAQARATQARATLEQAQQALQEAKAAARAQAQSASLAAASQPLVGGAPYADFAGGGWGVFSSSNYAGTDQGVDFTGGGAIPALAAGRVTDVRSEQIIEGGSYPVVAYQLEEGPYAGSYVYVMENFRPTVQVGQQLTRGETLGVASGSYPYIEVGFASGPDGSPAAPLYPDPHGAKPQGAVMWSYIRSLLGDPPPGPSRTLLSAAPAAAAPSTPVFRVVPMAPQQSVVYFSAS